MTMKDVDLSTAKPWTGHLLRGATRYKAGDAVLPNPAGPQPIGYAVVGDRWADTRVEQWTVVEPLLQQMMVEDCGLVPSAGGSLLVAAHLAFVLQRRLDPGADAPEVLQATAAVLPALRVTAIPTAGSDPGARPELMPFGHPPRPEAGTARTVACVLGDAVLVTGNLDDLLVTLKRDGVVVAAGEPTEMQLPPVEAVAWLSSELSSCGDALSRGAIVLSGALHTAVPVASGHHVRADMLGVGSVCARVGP